MNCREFADFLNLYVEGELPGDQRRVFDQHLAECAACRAYLDGYQKTVRALGAAAAVEHVPPAPHGLVAAILAARRKESAG
ncbi:Uncharacterized protein OS=Planctomyces limnophilus (strain ATCC 43296 / DSM 3776 / IFAM 1008 / 290) GN=Plim_3810 PE=4 SV=1: zf-HC2 [Gemmataceae bacterium]|nr:Uncharacterized protein OS=Planctomyces limnophilus (strain ATCC 43296 / DSM 3776 / IFAM 1008 / 290) GN=Plim_3810 PE=4 SV=1: zf-HC2 [Gemmataceae bacterium]VTT98049.1 Uncharacterized protein OS=Planctomyces limnophilus (strain ATCC 43296 / DSM 3776 / IFAM 1008 / 290) GN=Plim_3810 PE=4 SV=1: zf-HC2 [Gemmataceae bacterium]